MDNKTVVLNAMRTQGVANAKALQESASAMTSDEIIDNEYRIPMFKAESQYLDYPAGFICKSALGNIVKLIQPYDSTIYTGEPETLPAQWGFYWSKDPKKAKPFLESATSPYSKDECCTDEGQVWKSKIDTNTWKPSTYPDGWEDLGTIEEVMNA